MKTIDLSHTNVLISRTDSIGDVILTLPICGWIKHHFPTAKIIFLGKSYTQPVLECYSPIDQIICWDEIEKLPEKEQITQLEKYDLSSVFHIFPNKKIARITKKLIIKNRIGTSHRMFHLTTCTIRVNFTRKRSNLHESQLNFNLLRCVGLKKLPSLEEIKGFLTIFQPKAVLPEYLKTVLSLSNKRAILHTKSQGSAVEWPIENYIELAQQLVRKGYVVYFSGTENEGKRFRPFLPDNKLIIDLSGRSDLATFIAFISKCNILVACSTGPLHIAAILGAHAIGLYSEKKPIHPGRWKPIGKQTTVVSKKTKSPKTEDINKIEPNDILEII